MRARLLAVSALAVAACSAPRRGAVAGPAEIEWVKIPAGRQWDNSGEIALLEEVAAFEISKTPVTNRQYAACAAAGACEPARGYGKAFDGPEQPVVGVNWEQARAFAAWAGARLPTSLEWDLAARGDRSDRMYPWGNEHPDCERAIIFDRARGGAGCGRQSTWPVCSRPKGNTPQGVCDMAGLVQEWVDGAAPGSPHNRVTRGRPWDEPTAAYSLENHKPMDTEADFLGFRLAR